MNLSKSAEDWLVETQKFTNVKVTSKFNFNHEDIIVVSSNYFKHKNHHLKLYFPIIVLALKIRKTNKPVWVMMHDAFLLKTSISACILVAVCGGSLILQTSTEQEAIEFGLIFPSGPHIWTINKKNILYFRKDVKWEEKNNLALFSISGDPERQRLYLNYSAALIIQGYEVRGTDGSLNWDEYCQLTKGAKLNINTSLIKKMMLEKLGKLRNRVPSTYVTHRVWEGFCSGAVVITNSNPVLNKLGFIQNLHYLDLNLILSQAFVLPDDTILNQIAKSGYLHFNKIIGST